MKKIIPVIVMAFLAMASCHRSKSVPKKISELKDSTSQKEISSQHPIDMPSQHGIDKSFQHAIDILKLDENSLVSCTADTIISVNPELVVLLDPLYQMVRNDCLPKTVQEKEKWMSGLRVKLSAYYDDHNLGSDSLSVYEKADSVMSVAEKLYEIDGDWSTAGMIMRNIIDYTFDVFREYNLLSQMLVCCKDDETKELIYQEWTLYEKLFKRMVPISTNMVYLNYWGGSIVGPVSTVNYCCLSNSRRDIYTELINLYKGGAYSTMNGVELNIAEKLLFDCINKTLKDAVKSEIEIRNEMGKQEEGNLKEFMKTAKQVEMDLKKLRPLIKQWILLWAKIDDKITIDCSRHHAERIASAMLIQWASTVTTF